MAYRNKTYVAFASEDIHCYRMMQAWRSNQHIEFNFFDAHDINTARDTSLDETIRRRLRERLINAKQSVVLVSDTTKSKSARSSTFLAYEMEVIARLGIPVVFANLNGSRDVQHAKLPQQLAKVYSVSVSFQPKIIKYALDGYVENFAKVSKEEYPKQGPHVYNASVYKSLGI
ncbi:TIR domain-containing protein [Actinocorallia sp. API 0066]|uniref:TIR domain-containing protein n=1 Tax=Actinocorallia sp. API 0066 TaxID=2896846 RepID=UPI001E3F12DE|nr:TIR domain-containing protein [Actinocorallia sp. API 0066]MCD0448315.1 TIR domain-containing protein [Actinocorallia sp. API 0066]